jgi:hypothetical protein
MTGFFSAMHFRLYRALFGPLALSGCCDVATPHEHLCDLGPLGWVLRNLRQAWQ